MRTKRGTQKLSGNSKTTKIVCVRCGRLQKVLRNDTKFCSDLCRVQERNFRLENGYVISLFEGTEDKMKKNFGYGQSLLEEQNPLSKDLVKILAFIHTTNMKQSWKKDFTDFIVYHFQNRKSKPYQIYYLAEKLKSYKDYIRRKSKLDGETPKYSYHSI